VVVVIKTRIATAKKVVAVKAVVHVKVLHQVNPEDVEKTVVETGVKVILAVWARAIQAVKVKVEAVEAQAKIPNNVTRYSIKKSIFVALRGSKRVQEEKESIRDFFYLLFPLFLLYTLSLRSKTQD
jgi:hypothetical protein